MKREAQLISRVWCVLLAVWGIELFHENWSNPSESMIECDLLLRILFAA